MVIRQTSRAHPTPVGGRTFRVDDDTTVSELIPKARASAGEHQRLLHLVAVQQQACRRYLAKVVPRSAALTYTNIAAGAFAAAAAAGPALGGSNFLDHVQSQLNVADDGLLYQALCAIAFVMSLASVITANVIRVRDFSARIAAVEACYAELDSLRIQLLFAAVSATRGAEIVAKAVARVPFIAEENGMLDEAPSSPPLTGRFGNLDRRATSQWPA